MTLMYNCKQIGKKRRNSLSSSLFNFMLTGPFNYCRPLRIVCYKRDGSMNNVASTGFIKLNCTYLKAFQHHAVRQGDDNDEEWLYNVTLAVIPDDIIQYTNGSERWNRVDRRAACSTGNGVLSLYSRKAIVVGEEMYCFQNQRRLVGQYIDFTSLRELKGRRKLLSSHSTTYSNNIKLCY